MKRILIALFVLAAGTASAQYKPVDSGSTLKFTISNFGIDVTGTFSGFQGTILFDPQHAENASFDVSLDANTVNTDNSLRDSHLKEASYFDVKNYPRIKLTSLKLSGKNGSYTFTGSLTIKNKTKTISFPFTAESAGDGFNFKGKFKINRKDFEVGGTSTIGNELEVALNVHAVKA